MRTRNRLRLLNLFIGSLAAFFAGPKAYSEITTETGKLVQPEQKSILQIKGNLQITSDGEVALFDYAMLKQFEQHSLVIKNPWFDKERTHSGPLLKDVLNSVKATGSEFIVEALNGYRHSIPASDLEKYAIVLAIDKDGAPMRIRDKGPVFINYPFDEHPELHDEILYARSVWMVKSITAH